MQDLIYYRITVKTDLGTFNWNIPAVSIIEAKNKAIKELHTQLEFSVYKFQGIEVL